MQGRVGNTKSKYMNKNFAIKRNDNTLRKTLVKDLNTIKTENLPFRKKMGKFLFEEADEVASFLAREYLWFRFLREHIGIPLIDPASIDGASLTQPNNPVYDQYGTAFEEWFDNLDETAQVYTYCGGKGFLWAQLALFQGKEREYQKFGVRFEASEGEEVPENGVEVGVAESENIIEAIERLYDLFPTLVSYARDGYAPLLQYPVVVTLQGCWLSAYEPKSSEIYHINLAHLN
jgi:hypothetical protein